MFHVPIPVTAKRSPAGPEQLFHVVFGPLILPRRVPLSPDPTLTVPGAVPESHVSFCEVVASLKWICGVVPCVVPVMLTVVPFAAEPAFTVQVAVAEAAVASMVAVAASPAVRPSRRAARDRPSRSAMVRFSLVTCRVAGAAVVSRARSDARAADGADARDGDAAGHDRRTIRD